MAIYKTRKRSYISGNPGKLFSFFSFLFSKDYSEFTTLRILKLRIMLKIA